MAGYSEWELGMIEDEMMAFAEGFNCQPATLRKESGLIGYLLKNNFPFRIRFYPHPEFGPRRFLVGVGVNADSVLEIMHDSAHAGCRRLALRDSIPDYGDVDKEELDRIELIAYRNLYELQGGGP